jgi:4a-hydroxytetrahydrobiopterin dehydratase
MTTGSISSAEELASKKCIPCEGGVKAYTMAEAMSQIEKLPGWTLSVDGQRVRRSWIVKDFVAGVEFINKVCELAEAEAHHPDIHLEKYRVLRIELWTHAINGLSENDFIVAAKINQLPIQLIKIPQKAAE